MATLFLIALATCATAYNPRMPSKPPTITSAADALGLRRAAHPHDLAPGRGAFEHRGLRRAGQHRGLRRARLTRLFSFVTAPLRLGRRRRADELPVDAAAKARLEAAAYVDSFVPDGERRRKAIVERGRAGAARNFGSMPHLPVSSASVAYAVPPPATLSDLDQRRSDYAARAMRELQERATSIDESIAARYERPVEPVPVATSSVAFSTSVAPPRVERAAPAPVRFESAAVAEPGAPARVASAAVAPRGGLGAILARKLKLVQKSSKAPEPVVDVAPAPDVVEGAAPAVDAKTAPVWKAPPPPPPPRRA